MTAHAREKRIQAPTMKWVPSLIAELRKEAKEANRPLSNYVETILLNRKKP